MAWPHFSYLGRIGSFVSLVEVIFGVLCVVVWFAQSIRRDPHDRGVRYEALAFGTLFFGALLLKVSGFWWPLDLIWFAMFFGFTACVVYLGAKAWLRRRKKATDLA